MERLASGQIEGLGATATFSVRSSSGMKHEFVSDESGGRIGHAVAVGAVLDWLEDAQLNKTVIAVGHRVVPYVASEPLSAKLLKNGTLKTYKGFPHGMPTTEAETARRLTSTSATLFAQ